MSGWNVWFSGNFWGHAPDRTRPGEELSVNVEFAWNGHRGVIPAVYLCGKGVVVDVCVSAPAAEVEEWVQRVLAAPPEEQEAVAGTGPLNSSYWAELTVNGRLCRAKRSCAVGWMPNPPEGEKNSRAAAKLLEHYGLDPALGWSIRRFSLPWATVRRPKRLRSLTLTLSPEKRELPGLTFTEKAGAAYTCTDPEGNLLTLRVEEAEDHRLNLPEGYPQHCRMIACTLSPEQPEDSWVVRDAGQGDSPRSSDGHAASIGIVGGADGPVAVFVANSKTGARRACSAVYFDADPAVTWRLFFLRRPWGDVTVELPIA